VRKIAKNAHLTQARTRKGPGTAPARARVHPVVAQAAGQRRSALVDAGAPLLRPQRRAQPRATHRSTAERGSSRCSSLASASTTSRRALELLATAVAKSGTTRPAVAAPNMRPVARTGIGAARERQPPRCSPLAPAARRGATGRPDQSPGLRRPLARRSTGAAPSARTGLRCAVRAPPSRPGHVNLSSVGSPAAPAAWRLAFSLAARHLADRACMHVRGCRSIYTAL